MAAKVKVKCATDNWCPGLNRALDEVRLVPKHFMNIPTGKHTVSLPALFSGGNKKHGVFLNFCPFCGYSFAKDLAKVTVKKKKEKPGAKQEKL